MSEYEKSPIVWTVITVTYNSANDLRLIKPKHLPSSIEWVVVDNGSADDSAHAAKIAGATRIVRLPGNRGFAAANNVALLQAKGRYVLFANPDLDFDPQDLPRLEIELNRAPGLVSPQLINRDGSIQPNGRGYPTPLNKIKNRLKGAERRPYQVIASNRQIRNACYLMGASIATTVEFAQALGGWDERYFVYYEDHDFGFRAWAAGGTVRVIGDLRWTHGWARETKKFSFRAWSNEIRSAVPFYTQYPQLLLGTRIACKKWPLISTAMQSDS